MGDGPGISGWGDRRERAAIAARLRWKDPAFRSAMLKDRKPFRFGVRAAKAKARGNIAQKPIAHSEWAVMDPGFDELKPGELPNKPRGDDDAVA
jgi:hypothetical protein